MRSKTLRTPELIDIFMKYIVMNMDDLIKHTNVSKITIQRRLKEIEYITSYNHNGMYYTLIKLAEFDESGLWDYKGIRFFKDGGLQKLIISQINSSGKGYTSEELSTKLGTRVTNQLRLSTKIKLISRKKYSDLYVYFSINENIQNKQIPLREKDINLPSIEEETGTSDEKKTIRILLEIIKNPDAEPEEIGKHLREKGLKMSDGFIKQVFSKYEIQKKGFPSQFKQIS